MAPPWPSWSAPKELSCGRPCSEWGAPGRPFRRGRGSPTFAKDGFREVASPAWLGRNRRLAKDYEENPRVSEAWVYLGMLRLLVKRLARAA